MSTPDNFVAEGLARIEARLLAQPFRSTPTVEDLLAGFEALLKHLASFGAAPDEPAPAVNPEPPADPAPPAAFEAPADPPPPDEPPEDAPAVIAADVDGNAAPLPPPANDPALPPPAA